MIGSEFMNTTAVMASSILGIAGIHDQHSYVIGKCTIKRDKSRVRMDIKSQFTLSEKSWKLI